jgi:hypothetical protein
MPHIATTAKQSKQPNLKYEGMRGNRKQSVREMEQTRCEQTSGRGANATGLYWRAGLALAEEAALRDRLLEAGLPGRRRAPERVVRVCVRFNVAADGSRQRRAHSPATRDGRTR